MADVVKLSTTRRDATRCGAARSSRAEPSRARRSAQDDFAIAAQLVLLAFYLTGRIPLPRRGTFTSEKKRTRIARARAVDRSRRAKSRSSTNVFRTVLRGSRARDVVGSRSNSLETNPTVFFFFDYLRASVYL